MSENSNQAITECLLAVWRRGQRKHFFSGLLAFTRWFVPMFLLTILIDRFAYLPVWARALAALAILAVCLRQGWRNGWNLLQGFNDVRTARQVEDAEGGMDSLLTTAVHFQNHGVSPGTSKALWEHTLTHAGSVATKIEPAKVVTMRDLTRPFRAALASLAVLLVAAIIFGSFIGAGFGRIFAPWLAIAYPTKTKIHLDAGEMVVQEGAPAKIEIRLDGSVPASATLDLQTGTGRPREMELAVKDGLCIYEIASASRDFSFRIKAGDARSDWRQVKVIPAPRLAGVKVDLDYPDYIDRATDQVEALTLTVPEETKVRWQLTLDTPISAATLHRDGSDDQTLQIGPDGRTLTLAETASASLGYSFSWTEAAHGFVFTSPRYFLQVSSDQAPRVELTSPANNLNAMLGRPLQLAVRASDDHGIGSTTITYRVNRRPEKSITLEKPLQQGDGEQTLDWDYRKELPDLQIGDTVSFLVEVADKYPGETGPHRVRTDSRRITFLSREDYLAEINKQMERLLTRVRALYRQERAAHELVMGLDPRAETFVPTCQLEAIRQEMVREQLMATATEVHALLDDLAANKVSDAVESESLAAMRDAMRAIATDHVARAADLLRAQVGAERRDPEPAIAAVNQAARELAGLVMQRGIEASREVFARESRMLATELARLRLLLLTSSPDQATTLAKRHEEVAAWTDELLDRLNASMRYDQRPLSVLGLSRKIHALRVSALSDSIRKIAGTTGNGDYQAAATAQYPLIRPLLEAEFTMRTGSEFARLQDLREQISLLIAGQQELQKQGIESSDFDKKSPELAKRQAALRDALVLAPLPGIAAPRPRLMDLRLPPPPPTDALRLRTETSMTEACAHLASKSKEKSTASQDAALASLRELDAILARWSIELAQNSLGVSSEVSAATDRVAVLGEFEARQIKLLEHTEDAALDEKNAAVFIEDQKTLANDVEAFHKELAEGDSASKKNLLPLLGRLQAVGGHMKPALAAMGKNRLEDALEPQEQAATALADARTLAEAQLGQYTLLQQLIGFQQAVAKAGAEMNDIVGGQNDLIAATKDADEKSLPPLLAPQRNLLNCLKEIAPSLDLVAARLDVGTPLVFAASDVEDALMAMEDGDAEDAADIQETAVDSLAKVQGLVADVSVQTGYIAEIVEFLNDAQSELSMLSFRQRQIRENTAPADALAAQEKLASDTETFARTLTEVAGKVDFEQLDEKTKVKLEGVNLSLDFNAAAVDMKEALRLLQAGEAAAEVMMSAEKALVSNSDQLTVIISMLNGLPALTLTSAEPPELHQLFKVLDIASKHRALLRQTHGSDAKAIATLSASQQKLAQALAKANEGEVNHPMLAVAQGQLDAVIPELAASRKDEAGRAQLTADRTLRHFIIQQALILNTAMPPPSSSDSDVITEAETSDLTISEAVGFVSDFVSGEAPKDKKSEWDFLGTRNRAALNQNFARELPLEYRATLKNYYERVAK
ncbi:MAG: hypothetical protein ACKO2G_00295 [Verrucomicrobiales bacterium]